MESLHPPAAKISHNNRILYMDLLRVICVFCVISIHTIALTWYVTDVSSLTWKINTVFKTMNYWSVPVYVMMSGALFLNPDKDLKINRLYQKNILKLLLSFLFWNLIYAIVLSRGDFTISFLFDMIFTGDYHMWYIFMIITLYIITPILRPFVSNKKLEEYFLTVFFLIVFVIPEILNILSLFDLSVFSALVASLRLFFDQLIHYLPNYCLLFFVLGHYLVSTELTSKQRKIIYALAIFSYILAVILTFVHSTQIGGASGLFSDKNAISPLVIGTAIFVAVQYGYDKIKFPPKAEALIATLSQCSFGIYLIHVLVLKSIYGIFDLALLPIPALVTSVVFPVIFFIFIAAIVWCLRKIPFLKYLL